jgi:predicted secreted protein
MLFMIAALLAAVATGCFVYGGSSDPVQTADDSSMSEIGGEDVKDPSGAEIIHVKVGEVFTVSQKGNATTGFEWKAVSYDGLKMVEGWYAPDDPGNPPRCGVGGTQYYKFTAENAGEYKIVLDYQRSWEGSCGDIVEYKVIVE